ncbi:zinc knuckle CX2CX4HX4C containing protein [Tanacetum coccineum]
MDALFTMSDAFLAANPSVSSDNSSRSGKFGYVGCMAAGTPNLDKHVVILGVSIASKEELIRLVDNIESGALDDVFPGLDLHINDIVQSVSIQDKPRSYVGAAGGSTTELSLEDVLENGPWMIRNSPIILKKWSMNTRLYKEELTRIPVWVKIHDVPIQVFSKDGLSIIASQIGKPIMLDFYTSSMCIESLGRSSFARCLIEINAYDVLKESLTMGVPLIEGSGFTIEIVNIEYEWKPPRYDLCKIFGHVQDHCPKKASLPPSVDALIVEKTNDGFQTVGKKKKKGKSKSTNGGQFGGHSVKQNVRYEPKATANVSMKGAMNTGNASKSGLSQVSTLLKNQPHKANVPPTKDGNITMSNSYVALDDGSEEEIKNVYDESANVLISTKTGESSSTFTVVVG